MKLVRIWDRTYDNLRGQQFVDWDNGTFTVSVGDPIAIELWERRELNHQITVESTTELAWYINRVDIDRTAGTLTVSCRPHVDVMRESLLSDAYLVWLWLDAEKNWLESR